MWTAFVTVVNLAFALGTLALGTAKAVAARRERDLALTLTASVLLHTSVIFLAATPAVYRAVGAALHSPNICSLVIPVTTLVTVAHAHAMTQLWQPEGDVRAALRRAVRVWGPVYVGAALLLTALYVKADLGPAAPLAVAAAYAHEPEMVVYHLAYAAVLSTTVVVTVRQCRSLHVPGPPGFVDHIRRCLRHLVVALSLDIGNAAVTVTAMIGALAGHDHVSGLAQTAWLATVVSCMSAVAALGRLMLLSVADIRTLKPLHRLVVEAAPQVVLAPGHLWTGFDVRLLLDRRLTEISDGAASLSPWWSTAPGRAVERLAADRPGGRRTDGWDPVAARAAATLVHAARCRRTGAPPTPPADRPTTLPGTDIDIEEERPHLVRVARHLTHPIVLRALALADEQAPGRGAAGSPRPTGPGAQDHPSSSAGRAAGEGQLPPPAPGRLRTLHQRRQPRHDGGDGPERAHGVHEAQDVPVRRPHAVAPRAAVVDGLGAGPERGRVPPDGARGDRPEAGAEAAVHAGEEAGGRGAAAAGLEIDPREPAFERRA
ncbi:hypothetical protein GCM10010145_22790 [Streptomyces ruber]|uniref:DUF6545 domain-containing protein n=2 Tax=Streptomyces TaxID=1883 RepID=A0A918BAC2_9ACTN|nr:DUF6545 domain-containing protein [Streptomyces ruber]GGQ52744.1 hypothetical protein GCM10010145_22790 [Streptomyces ruber]